MWDSYRPIMEELDDDLSEAACSIEIGDDKLILTDLLLVQLIRTLKKLELEAPVTRIYFREDSSTSPP